MSGAQVGYFNIVQLGPGSSVPRSSDYEVESLTGDFESHGGVGRTTWSTFSNGAMAHMRIENVGPRRMCRPVPGPPSARPDFANWGVGGAVESCSVGGSQEQLPTVPTTSDGGFGAAVFAGTPSNTRERPEAHRQSKKRGRTGQWTDEQLVAVVAAVDAGCQLASTTRAIGIPATSLKDHVHGKTIKRNNRRQGVLTVEEETALVKWMLEMQDHAHPISIFELRRKVAEITQEQWTPFTDGIPDKGWLKWFRNRHPELTLRSAQGLDEGRARGLNPSSVASLYENLQKAYEEHSYSPSHIWNADESEAQAGRNGGGTLVFARRGTRSVHTTIPSSNEHLTVLSTVNALGQSIPNFYIFKGKRKLRNYIVRCEQDSCMAMQPNGWMTAFLFSAWITHFLCIVRRRYGISQANRHLLILDGHGSHLTLEVVQKAKSEGLDIITLPSHTSHRLQPLDVTIFKPFKTTFRACRDRWTIQNKGHTARKEDLAEWVSIGL